MTKRFGRTVAVDDVTIDVPPGRCLGWLGPERVGEDAASQTLGDLMLLPALDRVTGADEGAAIPAAAAAVVCWVAGFWAAGAVRIHRDEY